MIFLCRGQGKSCEEIAHEDRLEKQNETDQ